MDVYEDQDDVVIEDDGGQASAGRDIQAKAKLEFGEPSFVESVQEAARRPCGAVEPGTTM